MTPEVEARRIALNAWFQTAPDPEEQSTPKAREQAYVERAERTNRWRVFENAVALVRKRTPIRAFLADTEKDLLAARQKFVTQIDQLEEAIPAESRDRLRYERAELRELHAAVRAIDCGVEYVGSLEMIPSVLHDYLVNDCGWRPPRGESGIWRGSIASIQARIEEQDERLVPAQKVIDSEMARSLDALTV